MTDMKKILESTMKIRFHDCDPFNHLNNSRYIDYIMTARGDQILDHYNLDIYKLAREQKIGWVTVQTQIAYLTPATVMEEIIIQTRLLAYTDKSLTVEALMLSGDRATLKTVMWIKLVQVNLSNGKSQYHGMDLISLFAQVVNPLPIESNFEERVKGLRQK
jgi:YbgC/YbaW family acyl-CoA thioester hydrolase